MRVEPTYPTTPPTIKQRYQYRDSLDRYRIGDSRGIFGNYDLARDGLSYAGNYGGRIVLDRIIAQRSGEPYLIGIELEIEGVDCNNRERVSTVLNKYLPDRHVCVRDGSLDSTGIEIVTSPLAPKEVGRLQWHSLLRELSREGCTSHDSTRCGLHISISRRYLKDQTWKELRRFVNKRKAFFGDLSRRDGRYSYCQFKATAEKYTAINLSKNSVAEFRFFRGTLKTESFLASLEIVRSLVEFAKTIEKQRDLGKRTSYRSDRYRLFVESNYPIASKYIGDRWSLLASASAGQGSGNTRVRYTDSELRWRFRTGLESLWVWSGSWVADHANPTIAIRSRSQFGERLSIEYNETPFEYDLPIDWTNSNLPERFRSLIRRGYAFNRLTIRSSWKPTNPAKVRFIYSRGGWGRSASMSIIIEGV